MGGSRTLSECLQWEADLAPVPFPPVRNSRRASKKQHHPPPEQEEC